MSEEVSVLRNEGFSEPNAAELMRGTSAKLLTTYLSVKDSTSYATHPELWGVMDRLMFRIKAMPAYRERPYLKYSWSLGAGNWANIPWIAFLDKRETTSTK